MGVTGIRQRRQVRVWFGDHAIVDRIADPDHAVRFEAAMRRHFISLRVTNDPWPPRPAQTWQSGSCRAPWDNLSAG